MSHKWNIEFENVGLTYPNGKEALKNINLKINEGEMIAIIGLSGAGKTTLLKTINKMHNITSGNLYVGDRSQDVIDKYKSFKTKYNQEKEEFKNVLKIKTFDKILANKFASEIKKKIQFFDQKINSYSKMIESNERKIIHLKEKMAITKNDIENGGKYLLAPFKIQINDFVYENKKINNQKQTWTKRKSKLISKMKNTTDLLNKEIQGNEEELIKSYREWVEQELKIRKNNLNQSQKNVPYYNLRKIKGKTSRKYRSNIGMVFQRYNLIYKSSVFNNAMSGRLSKMNVFRAFTGLWSKKDQKLAFNALADVDILELAYSKAEDLSGGQMQRVALARTITQEARIFLADEPVGALDPIMAKSVMDSFLEINQKTKKTVLMNLHHVDLALTYADRIIGVKDGQILYDGLAIKVDLKVLKKIYGNELEGFDKDELKEIMRKRKKIKG